jgi:hypothetical protein
MGRWNRGTNHGQTGRITPQRTSRQVQKRTLVIRSDAHSSERQLVISLGHRQATLPSGLDVPLRVACCFGQSECDGTCKTIYCKLAIAMTFPREISPRRRQFLGFWGMHYYTACLGFSRARFRIYPMPANATPDSLTQEPQNSAPNQSIKLAYQAQNLAPSQAMFPSMKNRVCLYIRLKVARVFQ